MKKQFVKRNSNIFNRSSKVEFLDNLFFNIYYSLDDKKDFTRQISF